MHCPVCSHKLTARYTKPGRTFRVGLMVVCPNDSRHFRGFINDPEFLKAANAVDQPEVLLNSEGIA